MTDESKKDFNAMLQDSRGMPKIQTVADARTIQQYGGNRMYFAPPLEYDEIMKSVPVGKVVTTGEIRSHLAKRAGADFTDPMTAGIFINIVAWASYQRGGKDETPYWRVLKTGGELNPRYPGGIEAQKTRLEAEGHRIIAKGRTSIHYYVQDFEKCLYKLD